MRPLALFFLVGCGNKDSGPPDTFDCEILDWYLDFDRDGYAREGAQSVLSCDQPDGFTLEMGDCDDTRDEVYPGAPELCDSVDNDCNGSVDDDMVDSVVWYVDADGDGYGVGAATESCELPLDAAEQAGDCDDTDGAIHPGADEVCDGIDNDCDDDVDDDDMFLDDSTATTWYADDDGDGFGDPDNSRTVCDAGTGYVDVADDCDDTDETINPVATETCGDEVDSNCDGEDPACE